VTKFWAIFQKNGKLRLVETYSNYGDPPINGPYIATNRRLLAQWCLPGDTVQRVVITSRRADD